MKITKILELKQILKFYVLKSNTNSPKKINFNLTKSIKNLKNILNTVFEFHRANKTILFVGLPNKLNLKINKLTNHLAITYTSNFNLLLPKLFKKIDIIVIILHNKKKQKFFFNNKLQTIPIICYTNSNSSKVNLVSHLSNTKDTDKEKAFDEKKLFFFCLNFLFKQF